MRTSWFFAEMRQLRRMQLPMSTIERIDDKFLRLGFEAANINIISVRIRPRYIEGFDATRSAKSVLSHAGVESVRSEVVLPLQ